ncbi:modular serine protease-like [Anastrepha obliqua]|uniref:modular serine protease-like n=1 Tax=Anastrepha obliqua TaxID=95512 RepID=UPI002409037A|nr:modular serine protease-like [Anastrepha obliqua]
MLKETISIMILSVMFYGIRCQDSDEDYFTCKNGDQIRDYQLCDGKKDCSDGSDEFIENNVIESPCLNAECTDSDAKCHYGACIPASKWCDTIKDCADSSDEWKRNCNTNRNPNELSCESGEFIAQELFCDGKAHCADDSDETEAYCSLKKCKPTQSPCRYGACIDTNKFCNGKIDCIDKSDENEFFAKCPHHNSSSEVTDEPPTSPCNILDDPNLEIYNENEQVYSKPGYFDSETRIILTCKNNYTMAANTPEVRRICGQQGWNDVIPKCFKFCNEELLHRSNSTTVGCLYGNMNVDCKDIKPRTEVIVTCADSYQMPDSLSRKGVYYMGCSNDSTWDRPKINCEPICGESDIGPTASNAPWFVRIIAQSYDVCGGTIISPNLVITAYHCLLDENREALEPNSTEVMAAKEFANNSIHTITIKVDRIYANRSSDVALLKLAKPFTLSKNIRPICVPWDFAYSRGFVNKWPVIREDVGVIKFSETRVNIVSQCNATLTDDQFCVRPTFRRGQLCQGDSGTGVITKYRGKHYLVGVISFKPNLSFTCTRESVVAVSFTKIKKFFEREIDSEKEKKYKYF